MKIHHLLYINFFLLPLISCSLNERDEINTENLEVNFKSSLENEIEISTKAYSDITASIFPCDFYILIEGNDKNGVAKSEAAPYHIPSGSQGTLWPNDNNNKLSWFARDTEHNFWSWTVPWLNDYEPSADPIEIEFQDCPLWEYVKEGSWKNGECLEKFIGAQSGTYIYNRDGMFVPLYFKHLVSKIGISKLSIVDNSTQTTITQNIKANMTFYGIPKKAIFYPRPTDNEDGSHRPPYVGKPDYDFSDESLTFSVQHTYNDNLLQKMFYVCPEIDFSKVSYKLEIYSGQGNSWKLDTNYGENGAFYGDFSNINFGTSNDVRTVLHAGEFLYLYISLVEGSQPQMRGVIVDWRNYTQANGEEHPRQGIFTSDEAMFMSQLFYNRDISLEELEEFLYLYGAGSTKDDTNDPNYDENLNIIKLYEDIELNGIFYTSPQFTDKIKCILDGMGHMIDFSKSSTANTHTARVGQMRNIYIRYYNYDNNNLVPVEYEYIIFIDSYGKIWIVDPVTWNKTETKYNINDKRSFPVAIDMSTGKVS